MGELLNLESTVGDGQKQCPECRVVKPVGDFGRNKKMRDGLQFYCKPCSNQKIREWKAANPDKAAKHQRTYYDKNKKACDARRAACRRRRIDELVERFKQDPCMDCGKSFPTFVMDFDHRPGTDKKFNLAGGRIANWSLAKVLDEIKKCDLVCSNCHRVRTYTRMTRLLRR